MALLDLLRTAATDQSWDGKGHEEGWEGSAESRLGFGSRGPASPSSQPAHWGLSGPPIAPLQLFLVVVVGMAVLESLGGFLKICLLHPHFHQ